MSRGKLIGLSLGLVLSAVAVSAVEWSELSPAAQRLVPEERMVTVHLKSGQTREGLLTSETAEEVELLMKRGTIDLEISLSREHIDRIERASVCHSFRQALERFTYDANHTYREAQCRGVVALIDEYLALCPDGADDMVLRERREQFAAELAQLQRGMQKMDGEWLAAVTAAVARFDRYVEQLDALVERFPRIARGDFGDDPRVREHYDTLQEQRRQVVREIPGLVHQSVPQLLAQEDFMGATREVTALTQFWIKRVIQAEGGPAARRRAEVEEEVFRGMDFGFILRMKERILAAYQAAQPEDLRAGEVNEDGMVYIPGGLFLMGDPEADIRDDNFPMRLIWLDPFWIDQHEVTNREYREFVEYVQSQGDYSMAHPDAPPLKDHTPQGWSIPALAGDDQPVVGVDWLDAYAYANWRGKRLPTEAEWERAARGTDGRVYPWGDEATDRKRVNWEGARRHLEQTLNRSAGDGTTGRTIRIADGTWDVQALQPPDLRRLRATEAQDARGPWGLYHMAGNAAEWVQDYYSPKAYIELDTENPTGPSTGEVRVFRGGSFQSETIDELAAHHRAAPIADRRARDRRTERDRLIGFRCVRPATSP